MEKTWCVYKHTNKENGKVYIGITCKKNPNRRWSGGFGYRNNPHFWQAIEKYGWDGFDHEVLFSDLTKEEACAEEIRLIAEYDSTNRENGYNHSPGGEVPLVVRCGEDHPMFGKHFSPEIRAKMSAAQSGEKHRCWGKHLPESTRKKIGDANRGRVLSEEQKQFLREVNFGKKASDETKKKMSLSQIGHEVSEETRQKIRDTKALKPVVQLTRSNEVFALHQSVAEASRKSGLDRSQIRKCCKGELKTSGGFVWQYV